MPVEVHGLIGKSFAKEYVEAVVADALKILPSYTNRNQSLFVINARRVAVILDHLAGRGKVIPVDFILQVIDGPMKERLEAYLAAPTQMYYVTHFPGSFFAAHQDDPMK